MTTTGRIEGLAHFVFRSHLDSRGALVRTFDDAVMGSARVEFSPNYALASINPQAGTLRGMHFQKGSAAEARLIACVTGAIHNVTVDLRKGSPTFLTAEVNVLRGSDGNAILVPPGCANGWMTLEPDTIIGYQVSGAYHPEAATGIRFDDPAFAIDWPLTPTVMSDADRQWPDFDVNLAWVPEP